MSNAIVLIENLVATVARAFYTDTYVVLLEGLMHEKYIIEEELGPRLKLSAKEVRKITTQLEAEMLIKVENVTIDDTKSFLKCYYIDYQQFVDAVRYRMHLMQKSIVSEEKTELNEVYYQCPNPLCNTKYSSLEVQRLRCADFKFICINCCPIDNFRVTVSDPRYRLVAVDNTKKLTNLQLLEKKMEEQMNKSKWHEGIFDLLGQLRDLPLSRNIPSQNITKGIKTSKITDDRVASEIKMNFEYATGQFGNSLIKKKTQELISSNGIQGSNKTEFKIIIESEGSSNFSQLQRINSNGIGGEGAGRLNATNDELTASLPHFLRDSRVHGANEMLRDVKSLQQHRVQGDDLSGEQNDDSGEQAAKRMRTEDSSTSTVGVSNAAAAPVAGAGADEAEDEEVAWEDGDEEEGDEDGVEWEDELAAEEEA